MNEAAASFQRMTAAKEASVDVVKASVLSELDIIYLLKEEKRCYHSGFGKSHEYKRQNAGPIAFQLILLKQCASSKHCLWAVSKMDVK